MTARELAQTLESFRILGIPIDLRFTVGDVVEARTPAGAWKRATLTAHEPYLKGRRDGYYIAWELTPAARADMSVSRGGWHSVLTLRPIATWTPAETGAGALPGTLAGE